jgi:hypothetical protein
LGIFLLVIFTEVRTHGVGFYQFAKDEESRKEQLDALKDLREKVGGRHLVQTQ